MRLKMKKKSINFLLICCIFINFLFLGIKIYEDNSIETKNEETVQKIDIGQSNSLQEKVKEYPKENILTEYKGFSVAAKLEIPEISLETYVLKDYSKDALDTSVTKLYGGNPNEIGNFCIAGHNFENDIMFYNLHKLEVGDTFFVSDNDIGKVEYEIYDIYKVLPEDVSCLSQETDGKKEVTLITCTNNAKQRIIVKAQEVQ